MPDSKGDLTGDWDGQFAYPTGRGPLTPFLATIIQRGGSFTGRIIEPDLHIPGKSAEATIVGVVAGTSVDFTKTYRKAAWGYANPVDYVGQLSNDGERITGMWSLHTMNGTFEMTRQGDAKLEVENEAEVSIELR